MKKSKLLMPLTGIAAIGAFAPVVAMTACHSNEYKIVASATCGNVIDEETELMTNRLGVETLYNDTTLKTSITLGIGAHLTKKISEIERGHIIKRTINQAGAEGANGTPFLIDAKDPEEIVDGTSFDEKGWFTDDVITLNINPKRIAELTKEGAATTEESFKFTITYEEFESDGKTSVGKQNWEYTVVACPKLHDCTTLTVETSLSGEEQINCNATEGSAEVQMRAAQMDLSEAAECKLNISFKDTVVVKDQNDTEASGWLGVKLTFAAGEEITVDKDGETVGGFKGTMEKKAESQFLLAASYFAPEADKEFSISFNIKPQESVYVLGSWVSTITTLKYDSTAKTGGIMVHTAS